MAKETVPINNDLAAWVKYLSSDTHPFIKDSDLKKRLIEAYAEDKAGSTDSILPTIKELLSLDFTDDHDLFVTENGFMLSTAEILEAQMHVMDTLYESAILHDDVRGEVLSEDFLVPTLCKMIGRDATSLSAKNQSRVEQTRFIGVNMVYQTIETLNGPYYTGGEEAQLLPFIEVLRRNAELKNILGKLSDNRYSHLPGVADEARSWALEAYSLAWKVSNTFQDPSSS